MSRGAVFLALILGSALPVTEAWAQSADFSALEQVFGEPVTTSVTGKPQRATDVPANMEIITQDDIRRSGATTVPDVLQFVTGLDVRRTGLAGVDVGIRGSNQVANPSLMVLVDGRQVYLVDYGRVAWSTLPVQLEEIRRIEVIKGPNSALYGFNAVSGVINIVTFDPLQDDIKAATIRGGTQNYRSGAVVATGRIDDTIGARLSFGGFSAHDYPQGDLSASDQSVRRPPEHGAFNLDTRARLSPNVTVNLDASMASSRVSEESPGLVYATSYFRTNSVRAGIAADTALGLLSLSAYRNETLLSFDTNFNFMLVPLGERQTTSVVQASDLLKIGSAHTIRIGLEYRSDSDKSDSTIQGSISSALFAGSLMWDWQITPGITLTNAVRVDHLTYAYDVNSTIDTGFLRSQYSQKQITEPSFNTGVVWRVTDDDTLRFMLARGVQLPTLIDLGLRLDTTLAGLPPFVGRPDLRPAVTWNAEIDYDRAIPAIDSTIRSAVFFTRTDDVLVNPFQPPLGTMPSGQIGFMSANMGYTVTAGLETGIRGHSASGFRWRASYALATTSDHTMLNKTDSGITSVVQYDHSVPRHVVIAGLGYSHDRWELDLLSRWQSSFLDFRSPDSGVTYLPVEISDYITFNGRVGFKLTENLTVALSALQFNQTRIIQTAGPPVERRIILGLTARL